MDTSPFNIEYKFNGTSQNASIHPCCREDNIVDYAVWENDKLLFTITKDINDPDHWVTAIKNADDEFEDSMLQKIGSAIEEQQRK